MKNGFQKALICICFIAIGMIMMEYAAADIPAGVKDHYAYNTRDNSIILVKKRLEELGYFEKGTKYSDYVSEGLKETILTFQKTNKVSVDGVLDRDLLEL